MKERSSRACSACKRRKVKCDGEQDCDQCKRLNLACTYPEISSDLRSRRTAVRGRVIKSCTVTQESSAASMSSTLKPFHFSADFFIKLVPDYSTYVLPTFPIISAAAFIAAIDRMHESKNDYALVCSLGALTRNVTNESSSDSPEHLAEVRALCFEALHARGFLWVSGDITINSIMSSVILAKCVSDIEHDGGTGYCYLREAISKIQVLRVDDPDNSVHCPPEELRIRERLYWLLFIHERFDNINKGRPAVLCPLANLPEYDDSMPININQGFNHLIQLFCMVDADFVKHWSSKPSPSMTLEWVQQKQTEIGSNMQIWEEEIEYLSALQQVDLTITHYWLRALVWQMSLEKFLLLPGGQIEDDHMSILYPVQLSSNLRSLLSNIPREAVEVHSTGILCKIFEITATASDILEHVIARLDDFERQARHLDDFMFLLDFLLSMPRLPLGFRSLLVSKFHKISSLFLWYSSCSTTALTAKLAMSPHLPT